MYWKIRKGAYNCIASLHSEFRSPPYCCALPYLSKTYQLNEGKIYYTTFKKVTTLLYFKKSDSLLTYWNKQTLYTQRKQIFTFRGQKNEINETNILWRTCCFEEEIYQIFNCELKKPDIIMQGYTVIITRYTHE